MKYTSLKSWLLRCDKRMSLRYSLHHLSDLSALIEGELVMINRKVLIFGGSGYLGTLVCAAVAQSGHTSVPVSRRKGSQTDIRDLEACRAIIDQVRPHSVVNLAGSGMRAGESLGDGHFLTNEVGPLNVALAVLHSQSRPAYFHVASAVERPLTCNQESDYALSRSRGTAVLLAANLPVTVIRIPSCYGPSITENNFVSNSIRKILAGQRISLNWPYRFREFAWAPEVAAFIAKSACEVAPDLDTRVRLAAPEMHRLVDCLLSIGTTLGTAAKISSNSSHEIDPFERLHEDASETRMELVSTLRWGVSQMKNYVL